MNLSISLSRDELSCLVAALANAERSVPPASLPHAQPLLERITAAVKPAQSMATPCRLPEPGYYAYDARHHISALSANEAGDCRRFDRLEDAKAYAAGPGLAIDRITLREGK